MSPANISAGIRVRLPEIKFFKEAFLSIVPISEAKVSNPAFWLNVPPFAVIALAMAVLSVSNAVICRNTHDEAFPPLKSAKALSTSPTISYTHLADGYCVSVEEEDKEVTKFAVVW